MMYIILLKKEVRKRGIYMKEREKVRKSCPLYFT